ncbi:MAG: zinc-binding dehydrogenase [Clostridia bacterium]|nr:zinc-binding dehydrogenase [Clostridia bacterium]
MKRKTIVFTEIGKAELLEQEIADEPGDYEVYIKTVHSTISAGTEKANVSGDVNISIADAGEETPKFPRTCGYSSSGVVWKVGSKVTKVKVGDRVIPNWGVHTTINVVHENGAVKIPDGVSLSEASAVYISTFPLAAIRKTGVEAGESALVMGLGILGCFAVHQLRAMGAYPIIAADPVEDRRKFALQLGADFALDPFAPDFAEKVKEITGGGADTAIEVTGVGQALDTTLDCMAMRGRIALLGCTRDKNFTIDYYRKVHGRGIQMFGAHIMATPKMESSHGFRTIRDETITVMNLLAGGRLNYKQFINEHNSPNDCYNVFQRLINDKNFPIGCQFDWDGIQEQ